MKKLIIALFAILVCTFLFMKKQLGLPIVAIANYGPLKDLEISIEGIKEELANNGFVNQKNITIEMVDIACDLSLIPQTIAKLRSLDPKVIIAISTPIAQFTKEKIKDIPIVFDAITDPVSSGLLKSENSPLENITGSSDKQNLEIMLKFVQEVLPQARSVGVPYLSAESNDTALVKMMQRSAKKFRIKVIPIAIDQIRDVPLRIQNAKGKIDFIYVGAGGLLSALPAISAEANKIGIPIINAEEQGVKDGLALASFGVDSRSVGKNAGLLTVQILKGKKISELKPIFPTDKDHKCYINLKLAEKFKIKVPKYAELIK